MTDLISMKDKSSFDSQQRYPTAFLQTVAILLPRTHTKTITTRHVIGSKL